MVNVWLIYGYRCYRGYTQKVAICYTNSNTPIQLPSGLWIRDWHYLASFHHWSNPYSYIPKIYEYPDFPTECAILGSLSLVVIFAVYIWLIYIHIHTYTYIYIHIHTYTYIYIHIHISYIYNILVYIHIAYRIPLHPHIIITCISYLQTQLQIFSRGSRGISGCPWRTLQCSHHSFGHALRSHGSP